MLEHLLRILGHASVLLPDDIRFILIFLLLYKMRRDMPLLHLYSCAVCRPGKASIRIGNEHHYIRRHPHAPSFGDALRPRHFQANESDQQ